jgi:hypothetical protein
MHDVIPTPGTPLSDAAWITLLKALNAKWHVPRLAVCFKTRDEQGLQRRWSGGSRIHDGKLANLIVEIRAAALLDKNGVHTTYETPVYHIPKDECGGGSAWACGMLDWLVLNPNACSLCLTLLPSLFAQDASMSQALRRADLLAGQCWSGDYMYCQH